MFFKIRNGHFYMKSILRQKFLLEYSNQTQYSTLEIDSLTIGFKVLNLGNLYLANSAMKKKKNNNKNMTDVQVGSSLMKL